MAQKEQSNVTSMFYYQKSNTSAAIHHTTVATSSETDLAWQMTAFGQEFHATKLGSDTPPVA
jgi:hypothetical protein